MITIHIVWFETTEKIYSTGRDYSGITEIEALKKWRKEFPNAILHSLSVKS